MPHPIVHIIAEWSPFDAAAHLRVLARHQVQSGERVAVIVLTSNPESKVEIHELGATPVSILRRWQFDIFALGELDVWLRSMSPRIVHFWGNRTVEWAFLTRWIIPQTRLVATLPAETLATNTRLRQWFGLQGGELDHIVVDHAANVPNKTVVIPPGVATPTTGDLTRKQLLGDLGLPADAQLITIAGPLTRSQLIDDAIWNFELVRTLHPQACLVILGDGPDGARLERYSRLVSEPNMIRFLSPKEVRTIFNLNSSDTISSTISSILAQSVVYWQPGRSTSIPTALLSAQSLGIPAVTNDISLHAQVITHGENGFLVSTENRAVWTRHTVELLENAALREQFAVAAVKLIAERFPLSAMLQSYDKLTSTTSPSHSVALCPQP